MSNDLENYEEHLEDNYDDFEDDDYDDDDYEFVSFGTEMGQDLSANVKQFLADYYGDKMAELDSETYVDIEEIIKEAFYYECDGIPDLLYNNRTITHQEFDEFYENYKYTPKSFEWPARKEEWFDRTFGEDDEEDEHKDFETYLKESDPIDLNEQEQAIKNIIDAADNMLDWHSGFADFTKKGYDKLSPEIQQYMDKRIALDLEVLTAEGFVKLQETIFWLITEMLDKLYGTIEADLRGDEEEE